MKLRRRIVGAIVLAFCAVWFFSTGNRAQRNLEQTKRSLRREGFKFDLREFNLALTPELSNRAAMLGTTTRAALTNHMRGYSMQSEQPRWLVPAGKDAALVLPK